jgi:hypothetical protein
MLNFGEKKILALPEKEKKIFELRDVRKKEKKKKDRIVNIDKRKI